MSPPLCRSLRWLAGTAALLSSALAAATDLADAEQMLQTTTREFLAIMYQPPAGGALLTERTRPVLEKYFNFALLTRRAVGPGWRQFTPEQQERITRLLTEVVIRSYCSHFDTNLRSQITYAAPVALAPDRCELPTTIVYAGRNIAVSYRAERLPEGWRCYDVIVEGVSLVANYRAQFTALSAKGGAAAIIHALDENLAANPPL